MAKEMGCVYFLSSDDTDSLKQNLTTIVKKLTEDSQSGLKLTLVH